MIGAQLAYFRANGDIVFVEAQAFKAGLRHPPLGQGQGAAQGAGEVAKTGDKDGFLQALFHCGHQGLVLGGGALKGDGRADAAFNGHLAQIIFHHRMQHGGQHLIDRISFGQVVIDIPFHEYRATIAGQRRSLVLGAGGDPVQGAAQFLGLLFDKAAGAGGTNRIHAPKR